jgi:hypothetical protein
MAKGRGLGRVPWATATSTGQRARAGGRVGGLQSTGLATTVLRVCAVWLALRVPQRRQLRVKRRVGKAARRGCWRGARRGSSRGPRVRDREAR